MLCCGLALEVHRMEWIGGDEGWVGGGLSSVAEGEEGGRRGGGMRDER